MIIERHHRKFSKGVNDDQREEFERDHDRILYCSAFRRLAGVTQVVSPSEGFLFHNRLTHSLKVAQVGRRLVEMLIRRNGKDIIQSIGLHPEVVEAACLGHDLGHPPFGHNGEITLNELINENMGEDSSDGFEGNAQTFRVVTKLSKRSPDWPGLNLTQATLNALLKYPWLKHTEGEKSKKFSAYYSEKKDFDFARNGSLNDEQSAEARIIDLADDITFSVHDVEDFYRAGLIPLHLIIGNDENELDKFLESTQCYWDKESLTLEIAKTCMSELKVPIDPELYSPFHGSISQKATLRDFTSMLVGRYVQSIEIIEGDNGKHIISISNQCDNEIRILKQLSNFYVFNSPNLTVQKYGQKEIIRYLFNAFLETSDDKSDFFNIWPKYYRELLDIHLQDSDNKKRTRIRFVSDIISSMTEQEIYDIYQRLHGISSGKISDLLFH